MGISPETNDSVKPAGEYRSHDPRDFQAGARRLGFSALSVTAGGTLKASLSGATSSSYTTPARTLVVGNSGGERARPHSEGERSHLGHTNHRRPVTTTIQVQDAAAHTAAPLPSPSPRRLRRPPLPFGHIFNHGRGKYKLLQRDRHHRHALSQWAHEQVRAWPRSITPTRILRSATM